MGAARVISWTKSATHPRQLSGNCSPVCPAFLSPCVLSCHTSTLTSCISRLTRRRPAARAVLVLVQARQPLRPRVLAASRQH